MLKAADVLDAMVAAFQSIPELVDAMGGDPQNIYAHHFVYGDEQALRAALNAMESPSILVVWEGTQGGNFSSSQAWKHRVAAYIRMQNQSGEIQPVGYEQIWYLMVKSPVNGGAADITNTVLLDGQPYPMDLPSIEHLVDEDGMDKFCAHFAIPDVF